MFKKYSIAIILVSFMLLSTSVINGKALNKNSMLYNYLIQEENTDRSILIKKNGKDVTIKYLPILNDLIKKKETSKISDFVRDVHIIIDDINYSSVDFSCSFRIIGRRAGDTLYFDRHYFSERLKIS
ncbi:hypothetical protein [Eggerthia catenaformis]|uniref:hypothetical protein n=1 Tax=Eggerthia catenaformis TaxID=31973 RepID=UPI0028F083A1|nr:hypothetical protein [Eggerthia catenaformis]